MSIDGQINSQTVQLSLTAVRVIDGRANMLPYDKTIDAAYDPYALVRSIWVQRRDYKVLGDSVPEVASPDPDAK
jgi:ABC-type transporter lipoprotein component MlaA